MIIDPILITGCARSGTSLTTGIIDACGAFGGNICGPTPANKKGQFENNAIRQGIVKPYLKSLNCDPMGQNPLPTDQQVFAIGKAQSNSWREGILSVIKREGYSGGPWYYKGAKMCLSWYLWHLAFPQAQWVLVRRKKEDIISSCMRTGFMRAYKDVRGWGVWVKAHETRFDQMLHNSYMNIMEVWPERIIKGDIDHAKELIEWLDLEWNDRGVTDFVTPKLWKKGGC